jgi:hypothetical protein
MSVSCFLTKQRDALAMFSSGKTGATDGTYIKTTLDGRRVEVIGRVVCPDRLPEADHPVPVIQHIGSSLVPAPEVTHMGGWLALAVAEARKAALALNAAQEDDDASALGVAGQALYGQRHADEAR